MAKRESARVRAQGRIENGVSKTGSAGMGERLIFIIPMYPALPHGHPVSGLAALDLEVNLRVAQRVYLYPCFHVKLIERMHTNTYYSY